MFDHALNSFYLYFFFPFSLTDELLQRTSKAVVQWSMEQCEHLLLYQRWSIFRAAPNMQYQQYFLMTGCFWEKWTSSAWQRQEDLETEEDWQLTTLGRAASKPSAYCALKFLSPARERMQRKHHCPSVAWGWFGCECMAVAFYLFDNLPPFAHGGKCEISGEHSSLVTPSFLYLGP